MSAALELDGGEPQLTIDQLAARVGMTVRNVRAYATRGLLPPPRLVGRTGYYGPRHVARLLLVREMLAEGYTLGAVERALRDAPASAGSAALGLYRILISPWMPDEPEQTDRATLAARAGTDVDDDTLAELERLGVVELGPGDTVRVLDRTLLAAGIDVVRLGIPPAALIETQQQVARLLREVADAYVDLFDRELELAGSTDLTALSDLLQRLQPVAAQAVLAGFRGAMAAAVARRFADTIEQPSQPGGGATGG